MLVRLAQGMTHMGKGTMTLNPFHSDRQLMCPAAVAGLLTICYAFLDANSCMCFCKSNFDKVLPNFSCSIFDRITHYCLTTFVLNVSVLFR